MVKSSGFEDLDQGAFKLASAGSGRYAPLQQDGRAVPGCWPFNVVFMAR